MITKRLAAETSLASKRQTEAVITSSTRDREGDVVDPAGVDYSSNMKNPTILFAHDAKSLPVARCVSITRGRRSTDSDHTIPGSRKIVPRR